MLNTLPEMAWYFIQVSAHLLFTDQTLSLSVNIEITMIIPYCLGNDEEEKKFLPLQHDTILNIFWSAQR